MHVIYIYIWGLDGMNVCVCRCRQRKHASDGHDRAAGRRRRGLHAGAAVGRQRERRVSMDPPLCSQRHRVLPYIVAGAMFKASCRRIGIVRICHVGVCMQVHGGCAGGSREAASGGTTGTAPAAGAIAACAGVRTYILCLGTCRAASYAGVKAPVHR